MNFSSRVANKHSRRKLSSRAAVALALALVVATAATTRVTAASLTMTGFSPTSGPVGTGVTITGTGFTNGDVVSFNGKNASSASANSTGTKLYTHVPAFATSGVVMVTDPATGQDASLPGSSFTVTQGIYAAPNNAWAGGKLVLSGSALTPDQSEAVYIGSIRVGTAITDRYGDFQIGVSVPWDETPGKKYIYALDPNIGKVIYILYILGAWPQFRHDANHLGVQTYETSITPSNVAKLGHNYKWAYETGGDVESTPAVADGMVYVGSDDGNVYGLNAATGKKVWSYTPVVPSGSPGPIIASPAVANGRVFVDSTDGYFYALDSSSGKLLWQRSITTPSSDNNSSPVAANGMVYVGTHDGYLYAFNQATGSNTWDFPVNSGKPFDSPAVANGIVYVGSQDGHVYAVNASTGHQAWARSTGEILNSSPTVANGEVYVGTDAGRLFSLNASNGTVTWTWSSTSANPSDGQPMESSPAVAGGLVFIGSDYGSMYAVSLSTGKLVWSYASFLYPIADSPAVANGIVFIVGGTYQPIVGLDAKTGDTLWDGYSWGPSGSSPVVSNGMVYIGTNDANAVLAFGL